MNTTTRIALITGGSRGIGRSMALHLAKAGMDIVITYRDRQSDAETVVQQIEALGRKAVAMQLDVGEVKNFAAFAEELRKILAHHWHRDRVDALVNNAGMGVYETFAQTSEEQFDALMNVHFKGVFFLTQHLLPLINDGGRIINISSGLTRFALPGYAAYAAMKGSVEVLSRYLAKELGPRGISVNTLAPGAIETDFGGGAVRDNADLNRMIAGQTALGRVGQPDDIGGAVVALLAPESGWINAQRIEISGGMFI